MKRELKIQMLLLSINEAIKSLENFDMSKDHALLDLEIDAQSLFENAIRLRVLLETKDDKK